MSCGEIRTLGVAGCAMCAGPLSAPRAWPGGLAPLVASQADWPEKESLGLVRYGLFRKILSGFLKSRRLVSFLVGSPGYKAL